MKHCVVRSLGPGGSLQLARGESRLLFDRAGGQCRVAILRGAELVREELLGLGSEVRILVEPRLPERPVVIELRPKVALAPGGWCRGYVGIPVAWQVWVEGAHGAPRPVERLEAEELRLAFLAPGGYVHLLPARLRPRRVLENDPTAALLGLHLCNRGEDWREVHRIYLPLGANSLRRVGNCFVARPVRVRFEAGGARLQIRPFFREPRRLAAEEAS